MSLPASYFRYFAAVGFPVHNQIEFERLLKLALEHGSGQPTPGGKYVVWRPGEGVELWVKIKGRKVQGCTPHFAGEGALDLVVTDLSDEQGELYEGTLRGTAVPGPDDGVNAKGYPLALDLPAFGLVARGIAPQQRIGVQAAALARTMICFAEDVDYDEWAAATHAAAPSTGPETFAIAIARDGAGGAGSGPVSAESHHLPSLAIVTMTARVLKAQRRINPANQQSFIALLVRAPFGGTLDVAADPQTASGELVTGGLIHGTFRLTCQVTRGAGGGGESPLPDPAKGTSGASSPVLSRLTNLLRGGS